MITEIPDNDEPIHHSEGKDLLRSCPSLQPIAISPPVMHLVLEQRMLEQGEPHGMLKRYFQRVFKFCKRRKSYIIVINCGGNILIEDSNIKTLIMKTNK